MHSRRRCSRSSMAATEVWRRRLVRLLGCAAMVLLAGCATRALDFPRTPSVALDDPAASTLLAQAREASAAHAGQSGMLLLDEGAEAFAARAMMAMRAERTLDVQSYIVHDGLTTRVLMQLVLAAAERGVRVRILLDDTASRGNDFGVATLSAHPNIEVRLFNPMYGGRRSVIGSSMAMLTQLNRLHRRMHNKLWVADNAIAVTGGRNLGDEYFGAARDINFADIDLLALGPVAGELSASFDAYWNSPNAVPVEAFVTRRPDEDDLRRLRTRLQAWVASDAVQSSDYLVRLRERQGGGFLALDDDSLSWGEAHALWDDPAKVNASGVPPDEQLLATSLAPLFDDARQAITLVSAYFVPGDRGVRLLGDLAARGVSVRVLTNSLQATDVPFVYGAYVDSREPLLAAGVGLYELKPFSHERTLRNRYGIWGSSGASLHTKAMVFDRRVAFVGSFNLDPRSRLWNTEVGVIARSEQLAAELDDVLGEAFDPASSYRLALEGKVVRHYTRDADGEFGVRRPKASPWRRLQAWVVDTFGPDRMM